MVLLEGSCGCNSVSYGGRDIGIPNEKVRSLPVVGSIHNDDPVEISLWLGLR